MNRSLWPVVAMLLGLVLVVGSAFSGVVAPAWTETEAVQRQKAAADFHAANYNLPLHDDSSGSSGGKARDYDPVAAKAKYEAARQEYEKQTARLTATRSRQVWLAWSVRIAGILMVVFGVGGYLRPQSNRAA